MTAIPASSVAVKTMADNTLRITFDVEPKDAKAAFALFGERGTPAALAALKVGTELPADAEPEPQQPKGGPLAKWAAMRGNDPRFQEWLEAHSPELVAKRIKRICGIVSRAELDSSPAAGEMFKCQIMRPWAEYCRQQGWTE